MGFRCCVKNCWVTSGKRLPFHLRRFPLTRELREKWMEAIGREDLKEKPFLNVYDNYRVCDRHFTDDNFMPANNKAGTLLKPDAQPSLFLDIDGSSDDSYREKKGVPESNIQGNTAITNNKIKTGKQPVSTKSINPATPSTIPSFKPADPTDLTAAKPLKVKLHNDIVISSQRDSNNSKVCNLPNYMQGRSNIPYVVFNVSPVSGVAKADVRLSVVPVSNRQSEIISGYNASIPVVLFDHPYTSNSFSHVSTNPLILPKESVEDDIDVYQNLIDAIKKESDSMKEEEKLCSILIAETELNSIKGFQDNKSCPLIGNNDKVMIFMAKGIYGEWKTPLAYTFSKGGVDRDNLLSAIKNMVRCCQKSGLNVRTIVCDQTVVSMAVFDKLYQETSQLGKKVFGIKIGDQEIIPLYDVLSLFKGIRNDLFNSVVCFKWQHFYAQLAVWDHLKKVYEVNASQPDDLKVLKNLTREHIEIEKEANVFKAAQVFSTKVASLMHTLARTCDNSQQMPSEAVETAEFFLFMGKLSDSVSGSKLPATNEKPLKGIVTPESPHLLFWNEAIQVFQTMEFLSVDEKVFSPSIQNWIHTLKGFIHIWKEVREGGRSNLPLGAFNHETLEEHFSEIRRQGMSYFSNLIQDT